MNAVQPRPKNAWTGAEDTRLTAYLYAGMGVLGGLLLGAASWMIWRYWRSRREQREVNSWAANLGRDRVRAESPHKALDSRSSDNENSEGWGDLTGLEPLETAEIGLDAPGSHGSRHAPSEANQSTATSGYLAIEKPAPGEPSRYPITGLEATIGRSSSNDIVLSDPSISRRHASIRIRKDGSFLIKDLGALNGLYVNDRRTRSALISEGDVVELGDVRAIFTFAPAPQGDTQETMALVPDERDVFDLELTRD